MTVASTAAPPPPDPKAKYRIPDMHRLEHHLAMLMELHTSEVQTVWNRFNSLLTANAVLGAVLAALVTRPIRSGVDAVPMLIGSLLGLSVSIVWWNITRDSWDVSSGWYREIAGYCDANGLPNPFASFEKWHREVKKRAPDAKDDIRRSAEVVIRLFIIAYVLSVAFYMYKLIALTPSPF